MEDEKLIIGLDFGTTYSGACWAHSSNPDELYQVDSWSASRTDDSSVSSSKVPTQIRYLANGDFEWGAQVAVDAAPGEVYKLFKLALEPSLFQEAVDTIGGFQLPRNTDKIITDYMTGIFNQVCKNIRARLGAAVFERLPVHVVLTVPAIWRDVSKQRTVDAFKRIPNLPKSITTSLLSEPEAAAISAIRELDKDSLKDKDTFVVVDAGGGTVDLISYTITSLLPVLEVNEASEGTGDLCGSALVDLRFQEFLTAKLQNEPHWSTRLLQTAVRKFEKETKRTFTVASLTENEIFNIPVPGLQRNPNAGVTRNARFSLKASDLHMFYEQYILEIIRLVKGQIAMSNDVVRSIILVGGFGASTYLRERLQLAINGDKSIPTPMKILQPPNAWSSVARGAAMKGLAQAKPENYDIPRVLSRTARKHYGFVCGVLFDSKVHASLASQKYWDGFSGTWRVTAMIWFIKRGDRVSENVPFTKSYYYAWPVGYRGRRSFSEAIYADEISSTAPIVRSATVETLCYLTANLSSIPDDQIDQRLGVDGRMYYYLDFTIESVYHSASTEYTLIYKGKRYDTVEAEYV
ncbi:hypothetical protein GGR51DRAFT_569345 [Nemania sp. FL0031]|nr:hypothetical protein GGR51DRAFT_569345 [Nemania sp. FL0031]